MSAILDKIKSTVRGRSGSRGSRDETNHQTYRTSEDAPKTPTVPSQFQNYSRPSLDNSAFHVTGGRGAQQSLDNSPSQRRVADGNYDAEPSRRSDVGTMRQDAKTGDLVPDRTSSRVVIQNNPQSNHSNRNHVGVNDSAPSQNANFGTDSYDTGGVSAQRQLGSNGVRKSYPPADYIEPRSRKSREEARTPNYRTDVAPPVPLKPINTTSSPADQVASQALNGTSPIRRLSSSEGTVRRKPVATSPTNTPKHPITGTAFAENEKMKQAAFASGHLKLPEGFDLNNTEQTHVTEYHRPAVTHETIVKQRTEIVQEAITRDIHYHHYYTYMQPIKVVEVLPPKHYFLDQATGIKTEIVPPAGWVMPTSTTPISPDYKGVSGWTRHYLVNDEHPNGLLESPPLKHEGDVSDLRRTAQQQAYAR